MNHLAFLIYHLDHPQSSARFATFSADKTQLLARLETLLLQTNTQLAQWLENEPVPIDWAVFPITAATQ